MSTEPATSIDAARIRAAVDELQGLIRDHYPTAAFAVGPAEDEQEAIHITATVDVDDPDQVVDLVIDRMLALQIDEGIPVFVIPIRTPERVAALLAQRASDRPLPDRGTRFSSRPTG